MREKTVNRLSAPTFGWLNVNEARPLLPEKVADQGESRLTLEDKRVNEELKDEALLTDNEVLYSKKLSLHVPKGVNAEYIQRISYDNPHSLNVDIELEADASLVFVQLIDSKEGVTFVNDVKITQGDSSKTNVIQLFQGEGKVYSNLFSGLSGNRAEFENSVAYHVLGNGVLDISLEALHTGKKTKSRIEYKGVLRDNANKIFRGTINFKKGASGAEGTEKEDVLILDDGAANKTVPLILCDEEDVAGEHGASIGRLPEDLVFYLSSRGLETEEIYELMADARISALLKKVPGCEQPEVNMNE